MLLNRIRRVVPSLALAGALLAVMLAGAAGAASPPVGDWRMNRVAARSSSTPRPSGTTGRSSGTRPGSRASTVMRSVRRTGDYATVPDSASLDISGAITMAAWVKPEKAEPRT